MKQKDLFINALTGLFTYWGSNTPPEVFWGCNDLLLWYEKEYNVSLGIRFDEEKDNFQEVIEVIKNS